jgi:hypothetical protein
MDNVLTVISKESSSFFAIGREQIPAVERGKSSNGNHHMQANKIPEVDTLFRNYLYLS